MRLKGEEYEQQMTDVPEEPVVIKTIEILEETAQ